MVLSLGIICLVSSGILAVVYALTKKPIEAAAEKKTNDAIMQVLPAFDGQPERLSIEADGKVYEYYQVMNITNESVQQALRVLNEGTYEKVIAQ